MPSQQGCRHGFPELEVVIHDNSGVATMFRITSTSKKKKKKKSY